MVNVKIHTHHVACVRGTGTASRLAPAALEFVKVPGFHTHIDPQSSLPGVDTICKVNMTDRARVM